MSKKCKYVSKISPEQNVVLLDFQDFYKENAKVKTDFLKFNINIIYGEEDLDDNLYINGVLYRNLNAYNGERDILDGRVFISKTSPYILAIHYNNEKETFETSKLEIEVCVAHLSDDGDIIDGSEIPANTEENANGEFETTETYYETSEVYIEDSQINYDMLKKYDGKIINRHNETFMLIRTNPKLTGNVKLVVDSKYDLYLDTFKVSDVLNEKRFRKQEIPHDGNYPYHIKNVFGELPQGEMFKLPVDALNPHKFYNKFENQYITDYEYGAETNTDKLYSENMKILAPLHIGESIPEFFCVFRYDGTYNNDSYTNSEINDVEHFQNLIRNCEVVKTFDLRYYTSIGHYLNSYRELLSPYLSGSCQLQFIEQDNDVMSENYRQGNNSWIGIDINRGVISNKIETSYFSNDILQNAEKSVKQEKYNDFITNGYERNNSLYPYILNIEFMFNDNDTDDLSMHRYFGLYLSANEFEKIDYAVNRNEKGNIINYKKYDANNEIINDTKLLNNVFSTNFTDRLFFMITDNKAQRVRSKVEYDTFMKEQVANKSEHNICSLKGEETEIHKNDNSFMVLKFKDVIEYGEHFRFIMLNKTGKDNKKYNICYEIVASNDVRLNTTTDGICNYISENTMSTHEDLNLTNIIYRISFYSETDYQNETPLYTQLKRIAACLNKLKYELGVDLNVQYITEDTISITSNEYDVYFQHIQKANRNLSIKHDRFYICGNDTQNGEYYLRYTNDYRVIDKKGTYMEEIDTEIRRRVDTIIQSLKDEYATQDKNVINTEVNGDIYLSIKDSKYHDILEDMICTYVDYFSDENKIEDTIRYFSSVTKTYMHPLSPSTYYYSKGFSIFSLYGYENTGWRYSNIVKFMHIEDDRKYYTVFDDILRQLKDVNNPLGYDGSGHMVSMANYSIDNLYLTDNIVNEYFENVIEKKQQRIDNEEVTGEAKVREENFIERAKNAVRFNQKLYIDKQNAYGIISPYNPYGTLISFYENIVIESNHINIYKPTSCSLSIMSLYNIKDFNMSIDNDKVETYNSKRSLTIPERTVLLLDNKEQNILHSFTMYTIKSGGFVEFSGNKFIIIDNYVYFSYNNMSVNKVELINRSLKASMDTVLEIDEYNEYQEYNIKNKLYSVKSKSLYIDTADKENSNLFSSIVPVTNVFWKSNGLYFDMNSTLYTKNIGDYKSKGFFTEYIKLLSDDYKANQYIEKIPDSFTVMDGKLYSYHSLITKSLINNPIRRMLIDNANIETAIGTYNSHTSSLEFVYYGMKFKLIFDNRYYNNNINLGDYNNFEVFIINDYDLSRDNEIYFSADENMLLIVNHKFDVYKGKRITNQVKNLNVDDNILKSSSYNFMSAPYTIRTNTIFGDAYSMYAYKNEEGQILHKRGNDYFVQYSYPYEIYRLNSLIVPSCLYFNTKLLKDDNNLIYLSMLENNDGDERFDEYSKISMLNLNTKTNLKYYEMTDYPESTYNDEIFTRNKAFTLCKDLSDNKYYNVSEDDMQNYIDSFDEDFVCYIIKNKNCETIQINEKYKPLVMTITKPNKIKYNYGVFTPDFVDMFEFDLHDYELSNVIDMTLLLSNTKVKNISRIDTISGNKVYEEQMPVTQNYYILNDKSLFMSNWDADYYRLYTKETTYKRLNGYYPGIEDKTFFGSRCITIKRDNIIISDFSYNPNQIKRTTVVDAKFNRLPDNQKQMKFEINITQSIYQYFLNNKTFVENWNGLTNDRNTSIKNYIFKTLNTIYNLNNTLDVKIYYAITEDNEYIQFSKVEDNSYDWYLYEDYSTEFKYENNEYILAITTPVKKNILLHPIIKIYRY